MRRNVTSEILKRGDDYRRSGAVENVVLRDDALSALVQGNEYKPYRVRILLGKREIKSADCNCPYGEEWEGWCKHIVAVLLYCVYSAESVEEGRPLQEALAPLDRDALQALLLQLAETQPDLVEEIASRAEALTTIVPEKINRNSTTKNAAPPPPDAAALRRRVRQILSSADDSWGSNSYGQAFAVAQKISQLLEPIQQRMEKNDVTGVLVALEAITDEYINRWYEIDDSDGDLGSALDAIGALWTEAFLMAVEQMNSQERSAWTKKVKKWDNDASDYGVDAFDDALKALEEGWDDPLLRQVLQSKAAPIPRVEFADDRPEWARRLPRADLNDARLHVLERQGRREEALLLARWASKPVQVADILIALGRTKFVAEEVTPLLRLPEEALLIARAMGEAQDDPKPALQVATAGLGLPGSKHTLALWVRDAAEAAMDIPLARRAAEIVVRALPDLSDWRYLQKLTAPENWSDLREALIDEIADPRNRIYGPAEAGAVDILLEENRMREALHRTADSDDTLAGRVADRAATLYPTEVIAQAKKRAEPIMNEGRSSQYEDAARWLARMKTAYQALGKEAEWRTYLEGALTTHRRKYRLTPLLKSLQ